MIANRLRVFVRQPFTETSSKGDLTKIMGSLLKYKRHPMEVLPYSSVGEGDDFRGGTPGLELSCRIRLWGTMGGSEDTVGRAGAVMNDLTGLLGRWRLWTVVLRETHCMFALVFEGILVSLGCMLWTPT